jgi:hypothetical protein
MQIVFDTNADVGASSLLDRSVRVVKAYLDTPHNEFVALYSAAGSAALDVQLDDIDGYETFLECRRSRVSGVGEPSHGTVYYRMWLWRGHTALPAPAAQYQETA